MKTIIGTDVSASQGHTLDWPSIAATDVRFVICKATEHVGYVDPTFAGNAARAAAAGLIVGSHHFFHPDAHVDRQAKRYFDTAAACTALPPAVCVETSGRLPARELVQRTLAFVEATEALWGRPCVVYTSDRFWRSSCDNVDVPELARRPLWVAHSGVSVPFVPRPWRVAGWTLWQFDGDGARRLSGGTDADFSRFRGSVDDLRALCARRVDACGV